MKIFVFIIVMLVKMSLACCKVTGKNQKNNVNKKRQHAVFTDY